MYEKTYGKKYDSSLDAAVIAKKIRQDIKAAVKAGDLPKGLKTSVRLQRYAGGRSIDIKIVHCPVQFVNLARVAWEIENPHKAPFFPVGAIEEHRYTEEARVLHGRLKAIHEAYNFDGSDIQTDYSNVNYYGSVDFNWEQEKEVRDRAEEILKGQDDDPCDDCFEAGQGLPCRPDCPKFVEMGKA
jgi:hypothetical protein